MIWVAWLRAELGNREAEDLGDLEVNDELQRVKVR